MKKRNLYTFLICFILGLWLVLQVSLGLAQSYSTVSNSSMSFGENLLSEGYKLYQEKQYQKSQQTLEVALDAYKNTGNLLGEGTVLYYLALLNQEYAVSLPDFCHSQKDDLIPLLSQFQVGKSLISCSLNRLIGQRVSPQLLGAIYQLKGNIQLNLGESTESIDSFSQAYYYYHQSQDQEGETHALLAQIQGLESLGNYRLACQLGMKTSQMQTLLMSLYEDNKTRKIVENCDFFEVENMSNLNKILIEKLANLLFKFKASPRDKKLMITVVRNVADNIFNLGYFQQGSDLLEFLKNDKNKQFLDNSDYQLILYTLANNYHYHWLNNSQTSLYSGIDITKVIDSLSYYLELLTTLSQEEYLWKSAYLNYQLELADIDNYLDQSSLNEIGNQKKSVLSSWLELEEKLNRIQNAENITNCSIETMNNSFIPIQTVHQIIKNRKNCRSTLLKNSLVAINNNLDRWSIIQSNQPIKTLTLTHLVAQIFDHNNQKSMEETLYRKMIDQINSLNSQNSSSPRNNNFDYFASIAWGNLGNIADQDTLNYDYTQTALSFAQANRNSWLQAKWNSQLGDLLYQNNDKKGAINYYQKSIENLEKIKNDLITLNPKIQLDFQYQVKQIYQKTINTLSEEITADSTKIYNSSMNNAEMIQLLIKVKNYLKISELKNFLQCLFFENQSLDTMIFSDEQKNNFSSKFAVFYLMCIDNQGVKHKLDQCPSSYNRKNITSQKLQVILAIHDKDQWLSVNSTEKKWILSYNYYKNNIELSPRQIENILNVNKCIHKNIDPKSIYPKYITLPNNREDIRCTSMFYDVLSEVYQDLIQPLESLLPQNNPDFNLVFALDGIFSNFSMAILKDSNNQYLVEKYNISYTAPLGMTHPQKFNFTESNVLAVSLHEIPDSNPNKYGFSDLNFASQEVSHLVELEKNKKIKKLVSLQDNNFTLQHFADKIKKENFNIIHIATHGLFEPEKPEDTFLLTYDGTLSLKELRKLLNSRQENSLELLVLSACETATSNDNLLYGGLGLAGMTIQSGAKSTIATLWKINDRSTSLLIESFYNYLGEGYSKTLSLRKAQLDLINHKTQDKDGNFQHLYADPYYWSPFILVGNWF